MFSWTEGSPESSADVEQIRQGLMFFRPLGAKEGLLALWKAAAFNWPP
jgi:hypothetical protein